jgi:hypothetical protein
MMCQSSLAVLPRHPQTTNTRRRSKTHIIGDVIIVSVSLYMTLVTGTDDLAVVPPYIKRVKEDDAIEHVLNGLFADEAEDIEIQEKVALLADNIADDLPTADNADVVLTSDTTLEEETQVQEYLAEQAEANTSIEDHYLTQEDESFLVKIITEDLMNNDRLVIVHAYRKLAGLCHDWDNGSAKLNREMIYSLGGHTIIVLSMKRHPRTFKIQAEGTFHFL